MQFSKYLQTTILLVLPFFSDAQNLQIGARAFFVMNGNVKMILRNAGMINNGNFDAGQSRVLFTGNQDVRIGGQQNILFHDVTLGKTDGSFLHLDRSIALDGQLLFASGFIDLHRSRIQLMDHANLMNERNASRAFSNELGTIEASRWVGGALDAFDPGNIGLEISNVDVGIYNLTIRRIHSNTTELDINTPCIKRAFILDMPDYLLHDLTLGFHYFPGELGGLDENALSIFNLEDTGWIPRPTTRDPVANKLTASGIRLQRFFRAGIPPAPLAPAIQPQKNRHIQICPNPVDHQFKLQFNNAVAKDMQLELYDQSGRLVQQKKISAHAGLNAISWEVGSLAPGFYYISSDDRELRYVPFIKR